MELSLQNLSMEPTKLSFLACDHLSPIFALLSGEDVTKLYFSGEKRIIQLLVRSVTTLYFNLGYYDTFSLPAILFCFPRLDSLSIVVSGSRSYLRISSSLISQLPSSLTHLEIDRTLSCQPPDYDNPEADHIDLSSFFPHLKSFIWRNPMSLPTTQSPIFSTSFTPNLLHLDLHRICLSCTDISHLPRTLISLKILVESVVDSDAEIVHFPPLLSSLSVCRLSYATGNLFDHLPETLTSLECIHGTLPSATVEKLPREMKSLSFNADDLAVPLLPPKLTSFRSTSLMCLSSKLYHLLPRSMIHFDDQGLISRRYNWDALSEHLPMLPPNLIRIPRFLMYCPSNLWELLPRTAQCAFNVNFEIECSGILKNYTLLTTHLPPRLHSVALHDANELCIKMLPTSITKMSILSTAGQSTLDPTWFNHLTSLAHLDIGSLDVAVREFGKFEPKLKSISLRNRFSIEDLDFKAPWLLSIQSADLAILFPRPLPSILHQFATSMPILHSLRILAPFRTDRFHALPRSVVSLTIDQLDVIGSLGIGMTQLPPKVQQIKLQRVSVRETEAADLSISESVANAIPKSINDLQIAWEPSSKAKWESTHSILVKDALEPLCRRRTIFTLVVDSKRT